MKKAEKAKKPRFYFIEQAKFIESIVEKGKVYRVNDIHDRVTAFCRENGLDRVTDSFCKKVIKACKGKLQQPGGSRNANGIKPKKIKPDKNLFVDCYNPDQATPTSTAGFSASFG